MTDAARNAVHVVAMFGVYVGIIAFITELWTDLPKILAAYRLWATRRAVERIMWVDDATMARLRREYQRRQQLWNGPSHREASHGPNLN